MKTMKVNGICNGYVEWRGGRSVYADEKDEVTEKESTVFLSI